VQFPLNDGRVTETCFGIDYIFLFDMENSNSLFDIRGNEITPSKYNEWAVNFNVITVLLLPYLGRMNC
jgi:hypothetical protein